jgi:2-methylcitrate dehydratase PrpD
MSQGPRAERLVIEFATGISWDALPTGVRAAAGRCLVDLVGVAAGGFGLPQATIVREHVLARGGEDSAAVWFTGRGAAAADAAWANATAIESLDAHDGHALTKGHAGVALLPGLLALYARKPDAPGTELLGSLVAGYRLDVRDVGARGDPDVPLSQDEIDAKFSSLSQPLLGAAGTARLRQALARFLGESAQVSEFAKVLGRP